jgi:hypothetical protein
MRLVSADRVWRVDVIELSCTGNNTDGQWIRISYLNVLAGMVRTPDEVERFVPLASLEEVGK